MTSARMVLYTGCMFAGKTTKLLEAIASAPETSANTRAVIVHSFDAERAPKHKLRTHDDRIIEAVSLRTAREVVEYCEAVQASIVFIDELQFFDSDIVTALRFLVDQGVVVYGAGLDQTFLGGPFGSMASLFVEADVIHKLTAVCVVCKNPATRTFRTTDSDEIVLVGSGSMYEPRCRVCWLAGMAKRIF